MRYFSGLRLGFFVFEFFPAIRCQSQNYDLWKENNNRSKKDNIYYQNQNKCNFHDRIIHNSSLIKNQLSADF